jgi:predicted nucleotidyltransferase
MVYCLTMNGIEQKLFVGRSPDGDRDTVLFDIARKAETSLNEFPEFVAIAPFGSRVKGHANEMSDYDYWVYVDVHKEDKSRARNFVEKLNAITKEYESDGIEVNFHIQGIDVEDIYNGLAYGAEYLDPKAVETIANLARITTGTSINDYREQVKKYLSLHSWTKDEIEELVRRVILFLENEDSAQSSKISKRVAGFDVDKYSNDRKSLWERRVRSLFTLV